MEYYGKVTLVATTLNFARATVASHATTADIWTPSNQINWTGTATTTAFPVAPQAGAERVLIAAGACSFTAGSNLLVQGIASGSTITLAANDIVLVRAITTTQFQLVIDKYDGTAVVGASLGLNTYTRKQTVTQGTANEGVFTSTGMSLTGSNASNVFDVSFTANTSGSPIALKFAMTNTASGAATKFFSFLAGASGTTEVANATKAGDINLAGNLTVLGVSSPQISFGSPGNAATGYYSIYADAVKVLCFSNSTSVYAFTLPSSGMIAFADSSLAYNTAATVAIGKAASGTLSIQDGTSATSTGYRDLKLRSLISVGGVITPSQYTNATEPSWVNGNVFLIPISTSFVWAVLRRGKR